jgi:hypothetical protein
MTKREEGSTVGSKASTAFGWIHAQVLGGSRWLRSGWRGLGPGALLWRLIVAFLLLLPVVGWLSSSRDNSNSGIIDSMWQAGSISLNLLQIAIVVLLVVVVIRYLFSRPYSKRAKRAAEP